MFCLDLTCVVASCLLSLFCVALCYMEVSPSGDLCSLLSHLPSPTFHSHLSSLIAHLASVVCLVASLLAIFTSLLHPFLSFHPLPRSSKNTTSLTCPTKTRSSARPNPGHDSHPCAEDRRRADTHCARLPGLLGGFFRATVSRRLASPNSSRGLALHSAREKSTTFESEFMAARPIQQSTRKEVTKRLPRLVVKWFPNCVFSSSAKKDGGGKEVIYRRPFSEGKQKTLTREHVQCYGVNKKSVLRCSSDDILFANNS